MQYPGKNWSLEYNKGCEIHYYFCKVFPKENILFFHNIFDVLIEQSIVKLTQMANFKEILRITVQKFDLALFKCKDIDFFLWSRVELTTRTFDKICIFMQARFSITKIRILSNIYILNFLKMLHKFFVLVKCVCLLSTRNIRNLKHWSMLKFSWLFCRILKFLKYFSNLTLTPQFGPLFIHVYIKKKRVSKVSISNAKTFALKTVFYRYLIIHF